ncbi:hypothetical protein MY3296_009107 [Beauveria thailandica]
MSALKAGDSFPEDVVFGWVRPSPETAGFNACGVPTKYPASSRKIAPRATMTLGAIPPLDKARKLMQVDTLEFKNKKVVLVSVPGAFTPTCSANHIPGFIAKTAELKAKGVDQVVVIACNDSWVMSAWGKANNIHDEFIIFASDDDCKFSKSIGWMASPDRTGRYALVIDHGKVTYAELEPAGGVTVSGADAILAKL